MKRLTATVVVVFALLAAFVQLQRFYARKFYVTTGKAQWIWDQHRLAADTPVVFFATREFEMPPGNQYVHLKVVADPHYVAYFNGVEVGGRRFRGTGVIDKYDVTKLARAGSNRVVIAVRSPRGVGGLLVAFDFGAMLENLIVSDDQWNLFHQWADELLHRDPSQLTAVKPQILGFPPTGQWDYITHEIAAEPSPETRILYPRQVMEFETSLPVIRIASGIPVAASRPARARAFDFNSVKGRARIEVDPVGKLVAKIRYANFPSEFQIESSEIVRLPVARGERSVVDPETRRFRYLIVYDIDARATVLVE